MSKTNLLILILALVVLVGLGLLISRQVFNIGGLAFEILTYALSAVALILAVLSVVNGIRQGRVMRQIVHDVHTELKQMAALNEKIEQDIRQDQEVNAVISRMLTKYGVSETEHVRRKVSRRTHHRIKKHGL